MYKNHPANKHSYYAVPAYQKFEKTQTQTVTEETRLITTHDLLSLIRQDCLIIMSAIEADALEEEHHHQKIQQIQRDVLQLKQYYLKAIPLFEHDNCCC